MLLQDVAQVTDAARIQHCCGVGWQLQLGFDPSTGTSTGQRYSCKNRKRKKKKITPRYRVLLWHSGLGSSIVTTVVGVAVVGLISGPGTFSLLFRAAPVAYGSSQARGQTGATASHLHHSHSHVRFEPHLQPTPQFTATPDP